MRPQEQTAEGQSQFTKNGFPEEEFTHTLTTGGPRTERGRTPAPNSLIGTANVSFYEEVTPGHCESGIFTSFGASTDSYFPLHSPSQTHHLRIFYSAHIGQTKRIYSHFSDRQQGA